MMIEPRYPDEWYYLEDWDEWEDGWWGRDFEDQYDGFEEYDE